MPRKRGANAADTRKRLISAATKEFSNKGYAHASLRAICTKAGVTTGALYFFFENKEALFREVLAPLTEPIIELLSEACQKTTPGGVEWTVQKRFC